jgi:tape measure domain-containing protein
MADVLDFEVRIKTAEEDINKLNAQLRAIANNAENAGGRMDDVFSKVGKTIGTVFATAQLVDFAKQVVNVRKEIEAYEISFRTLLGSQDKADALFGSLREFAVKTPMQLGDLAKGAQTLLGFGIEADKIMPTLKQIGDISMGNAEKFGSLTLAFAQMSSTGKLMGQDLLQMINAGFNPLSIISQKTGKSIGELKKEMEKGAISVEMVADAFKTATSEGGMFYGMLEKQGEGLAGAIAQLQGAWEEALNTLGERSQGLIVNGIKGVTKLVENFDTLISVILGVASAFGVYKTVLISVNIVETIAKFNELRKTLPGLDCGMCGSPSCRCFAEDVVAGKADVNDCIFNMKDKEGVVIPKPFRTENKEDK